MQHNSIRFIGRLMPAILARSYVYMQVVAIRNLFQMNKEGNDMQLGKKKYGIQVLETARLTTIQGLGLQCISALKCGDFSVAPVDMK